MTNDEIFPQPHTYTCPFCGTDYALLDNGLWEYDGPGGLRKTVHNDQLSGFRCCYACAMARRNTSENRLRYVKATGAKAAVVSQALGTSAGSAITKRDIFQALEESDDELLHRWISEYLSMADHTEAYTDWLLAQQQ